MLIQCNVHLLTRTYGLKESLSAVVTHRVEHDDASREEILPYAFDHLLQFSSMSTNEYCIWTREIIERSLKKITDVDTDARSTELTAIESHQLLTFGPYLKSLNAQMREMKSCLYADTACAETHIPQCLA